MRKNVRRKSDHCNPSGSLAAACVGITVFCTASAGTDVSVDTSYVTGSGDYVSRSLDFSVAPQDSPWSYRFGAAVANVKDVDGNNLNTRDINVGIHHRPSDLFEWDLSWSRSTDDEVEVAATGIQTSWKLNRLWQGTRDTWLDLGATHSEYGLTAKPDASLGQTEYSLGLTQNLTGNLAAYARWSQFDYDQDPEEIARALLKLRKRRRALPSAEGVLFGLVDSTSLFGLTYNPTDRVSLDLSRSSTTSVLLDDNTSTDSVNATYYFDGAWLGLGYSRTRFDGGPNGNTLSLSLGIETGKPGASGNAAAAQRNPELPTTSLTAGLRIGENNAFDNFVDLLIPLAGNRSNVFFVNPRFSLNESYENGTSVGMGFRHLLANEKAILGANLFYDHGTTEANSSLEQWGLGLEMLSNWVDARVNWYRPRDDRNLIASEAITKVQRTLELDYGDPYGRGHEILQSGSSTLTTTTTNRLFEKFDAGREGYDAEIGVRLPLEKLSSRAPDVRVFVGRYDYEDPFGGENLRGTRGRIEVRALPALTLDMELYNDDNLHGTNYFVGARVNVPFSLGDLVSGKNPFAGRSKPARSLPARMNEMVQRETQIQQAQSDFIENLAAKSVTVDVQRDSLSVVLMSDINFVDADKVTGTPDGTYENPYTTIQAGIDNAYGLKNVYVDSALTSYTENLVLTDGVQLYGSGYRIEGYGGKYFGSGIMPVIDGNGAGAAIEVTSNNLIQGLHIVNTAPSGGPVNRALPDGTIIDVSQMGIIGGGIEGSLLILDNQIDTAATAVALATTTTPATVLIGIGRNTISSQNGAAIDLRSYNNALTAAVIGENNLYGQVGIRVNTNQFSQTTAILLDNSITAVTNGIMLDTDGLSLGCMQARGNTVSAGGNGIVLDRFLTSSLQVGRANNPAGLSGDNGGASVSAPGSAVNYLGANTPCL